jgi:hypothetical protein
MVGGTIRRKLIHRESFRASVLHLSENQAVLQSMAAKKCVLTKPSLLSSGTYILPSDKGLPPAMLLAAFTDCFEDSSAHAVVINVLR